MIRLRAPLAITNIFSTRNLCGRPVSRHPHFESHALLDFVITVEVLLSTPSSSSTATSVVKPNPAEIHAEDWHVRTFHQRCDIEQRAIATERDNQIRLCRHLFFACRIVRRCGASRFDAHFLVALFEPRHQPTNHLRCSLGSWYLAHKIDGSNHQEKSLLGEITMGYENVHGITDCPEQTGGEKKSASSDGVKPPGAQTRAKYRPTSRMR